MLIHLIRKVRNSNLEEGRVLLCRNPANLA